ncbi:universal stress protein [Haloplanus sp. C73]|uniref:universal stress protein n=1 Tax=Haloplanus sp. C73 TaxID=3421641 RepID=UPI003EBEDD07
MVILVPFDGSTLSRTALLHASRSAGLYNEAPLAVTAIPDGNADYARRKGWLTESESFDRKTIVSRLREQVAELAPDADFEYVLVDAHAPPVPCRIASAS